MITIFGSFYCKNFPNPVWSSNQFASRGLLKESFKIKVPALKLSILGKPSGKKSAVFFNIVQKAFDPPYACRNNYQQNNT